MPRAGSQQPLTESKSDNGMQSDEQSDHVAPLNTPDTEDPHSRLHWMALPPLPTRKSSEMRSQACGGITVVLFIIGMCVSGAHFFTLKAEGTFPVVLNILVWTEAVVALLCLLGLMFGDPGEIKRSEANCTVRASPASCTPAVPDVRAFSKS